MQTFKVADIASRSSRTYRFLERLDLASERALADSLTGRLLSLCGRMLKGSALGRWAARGTGYRYAVSSSIVGVFFTRLFLAFRAPALRLSDFLAERFTTWRGYWRGSRVSQYCDFLFRLETGVLFLVLFIPIELYLFRFIPRSTKYLVELVLLTMTAALLWSALRGRRELRLTELELPVAAFAVVGIVSAVANGVPAAIAIAGLRALLQFYLLYFIVVQAGFDREWLKKLILVLMGFAILLALFGLTQIITGIPSGEALVDVRETSIAGRIVSTFENPNNFGGFLLLMLSVAIALALDRTSGSMRAYAILGIAVILLALVLTYSRGAWLGLVVALIVLAILKDQRLLAVMALAVLVVIIAAPSVVDRLAFGFSGGYMQTSSTGGRLLYWRKAIEVMMMNPLLGAGPGRFGGAVAAIFTTPVNALVGFAPNYQLWVDSQVFQILAELGLLGIAAFLWVPVTFARNAVAYIKKETDPFWRSCAAGCIAAVAGILVQGMVVGVWETHQIAAFFWLMMAIVMSLAVTSETGGEAG